jgi:hypothetical protein
VNFDTPLDVLSRHGIRFVIVGGVAMNLQGSAQNTTDLDIVYDRDAENVERLAAALAPYSPRLRGVRDKLPFRLDAAAIRSGLNFTLTTSLGDIDLWGELRGVGGFDAVCKLSRSIRLGKYTFSVLSLSGLIKAKRAAGRPKDRLVIPELEALAEAERETELPDQR